MIIIVKESLTKIGIILLIAILGIGLLAAMTRYIFIENGSYNEDDWGSTGFVVNQMAISNAGTQSIAKNDDGEWGISIDLNTTVQDIINKLEENDGVLDQYISKSKQQEYLTAFIRAELITQYPDLRSADKIGTPTEDGQFQGCIQIHRASSSSTDGQTQKLTYIDYDTFNSYITGPSQDSTALQHFTLDSNGNLVVAGWTRTTTNITSNIPDVQNVTNQVEYKLTTNSIQYQSLLEKYMMPFDLLWALTVMEQDDGDFAYNLAQLALDSQIIFTVQDNLSTIITERVESYDTQRKRVETAGLTVTDGENFKSTIAEKEYEDTPKSYETKTVIKTEACATNIDITYADTWIVEYINTYTNTIQDEKVDEPEPSTVDDTRYEYIGSGTGDLAKHFSKELQEFQRETFEEQYGDKYLEMVENKVIVGTVGEVSYSTYSRTINQKVSNKSTTSYNIYVRGTPTVNEKVDKDSAEDNFVTLFIKSSGKENITGAAEWLFSMLENSPKAADSVDLIKFLLYKATEHDFGVKEFDFSIYKQSNFRTLSSGRGLAAYLRQFSHSGEAPQSADGNYYMMYGDTAGWPTIGTADLQWKSHYSKFNKAGKVIHKGQELEVDNVAKYINDNCLTKGAEAEYSDAEVAAMQVGIEKKLVDDIGNTVQQVYYAKVQEATDGLTLSRQQLYALTAIAYNFGHLPTRNGMTFKQAYEAGMQENEEGSWQHNQYIWDNWWCALGGGYAGHIPSRDAAFETYVKAVFDFSESEAGEVFERNYYIYYTSSQLAKFDYAPSKTIKRTTANEEEIFTMVKATGTFEPDYTDTRVKGYYTSTMGRVFTVLNQTTIDGWSDKCNRAAAAIIASGYVEETATQLIDSINNNKKAYKWDSVPTNDYFNLYGLKVDEEVYAKLSVSEYTSIIRDQLELGGYAMVWLNNNETTYTGKSLEKWTSLYHWVAIVDYRVENGIEEIMVLDYRGGDWYPIDEFQFGISHYALISEM